ncbi:MAG: DUF4105 domain-containing protein [Oligoflexus sp.]|nr:DUF4105 domain-containing protein [Oligoflexus sp.]
MQALIDSANRQELWQERSWRKLLFIPDLFYPSDLSIIDDPSFFASPSGQAHPREELLAALKGLFEIRSNPDEAMVCRFPARAEWLIEKLLIDRTRLPKVLCPRLEQYKQLMEYSSATLIFSNYYIDNPASMFGHVFMRLGRLRPEGNDQALLDDALGFSAFVSDPNDFLYPIKGLAGVYKGKFSVVPFYNKIEEYNNYESRDLWEYQLNLTPAELEKFKLILWELGPRSIDYYFLDDNCALMMVAMLEAVRPSLAMTGSFKLYTIPSDTLRVISKQDKLVGAIRYRPSSLSRYRADYDRLDHEEQTLVREISEGREFGQALEGRTEESKAAIIDTMLGYVDFKEKLAGNKIPEKYRDLRPRLLMARAKTRVRKKVEQEPRVYSNRPDLGHPSAQYQLGLGRGHYDFAELKIQPALHDLNSSSLGYSDGMAIAFLSSTWRKSPQNAAPWLKEFHAIEITSIPEDLPLIRKIGWHLDLGYSRVYEGRNSERTGRFQIKGGAGPATQLFNGTVMLYSRAELGIAAAQKSGILSPSLVFGAIYLGGRSWKLTALSERIADYRPRSLSYSSRHSFFLNYFYSDYLEMRVGVQGENDLWEGLMAVATFL